MFAHKAAIWSRYYESLEVRLKPLYRRNIWVRGVSLAETVGLLAEVRYFLMAQPVVGGKNLLSLAFGIFDSIICRASLTGHAEPQRGGAELTSSGDDVIAEPPPIYCTPRARGSSAVNIPGTSRLFFDSTLISRERRSGVVV